MSALKHSGMRIIALPLTATSSHATGRFTYYHFQMPPPQTVKEKNLVQKAASKASSLWANFGKAEDGSWKVSPQPLKFLDILPHALEIEFFSSHLFLSQCALLKS